MSTPLAFLVPAMIDDRERVSGGNVYDRRLCAELRGAGRAVRLLRVGSDEGSGGSDASDLAHRLADLPDGGTVLIDGLLVSRDPSAVLAHRARLDIAILAHMDPADPAAEELAALRSARLVVATSDWTRIALAGRGVAPGRIVVARPGADPAPLVPPSELGGRLLCVAAVAPHKGQDLLVEALAGLADLEGWSCAIVGSRTADPGFAAELDAAIAGGAVAERVAFAGVLGGEALEAAYARSDLLVHPARSESYGMVVAEALAHGIPVVAAGVGGIGEAIARGGAAALVPPGDPAALGEALRRWLTDPGLRATMRGAAAVARASRRPWSETAAVVSAALDRRTGSDVPAEDLAGMR